MPLESCAQLISTTSPCLLSARSKMVDTTAAVLTILFVIVLSVLLLRWAGGVDKQISAGEPIDSVIKRMEQSPNDDVLVAAGLSVLHGHVLLGDTVPPPVSDAVQAADGVDTEPPSTTANSSELGRKAAPVIFSALTIHEDKEAVVKNSLALLSSLGPPDPNESGASSQSPLLRSGAISTVTAAVRRHEGSVDIARYGLMAIGNLVSTAVEGLGTNLKPAMRELEAAVDVVIDALHLHAVSRVEEIDDSKEEGAAADASETGGADVAVWGLYALLHVAAVDSESQIASPGDDGAIELEAPRMCAYVVKMRGVETTVECLRRYGADERLAAVGVLMLALLATNDLAMWPSFLASGGFEVLKQTIGRHPSNSKIQEVGGNMLRLEGRVRNAHEDMVKAAREGGGSAGADA